MKRDLDVHIRHSDLLGTKSINADTWLFHPQLEASLMLSHLTMQQYLAD
jgi:hypothetical protein